MSLVETNRTYLEMINSLVEDIDFWKRKYYNKIKENQVLGQVYGKSPSSQFKSWEFSKDMTVAYVDEESIPTFRARQALCEEMSESFEQNQKNTVEDPSTFKGEVSQTDQT